MVTDYFEELSQSVQQLQLLGKYGQIITKWKLHSLSCPSTHTHMHACAHTVNTHTHTHTLNERCIMLYNFLERKKREKKGRSMDNRQKRDNTERVKELGRKKRKEQERGTKRQPWDSSPPFRPPPPHLYFKSQLIHILHKTTHTIPNQKKTL